MGVLLLILHLLVLQVCQRGNHAVCDRGLREEAVHVHAVEGRVVLEVCDCQALNQHPVLALPCFLQPSRAFQY